MALHTDLPIYKSGADLLTMGYWLQENMPRALKRTLGEKLVQHCADMLELMALANATRALERIAHLERLMVHKRAMQALLRVAKDRRAISLKAWSRAIELLETVGRQCGGWIKSANRAPAA